MPRCTSTVWEHFLIISDSGSKKHVTCNYCNIEYKHAQANRLKEHLLKCKNCPKEVKTQYNLNKNKHIRVNTCASTSSSTHQVSHAVSLPTETITGETAPRTPTTSASTFFDATDTTDESLRLSTSSNNYTHSDLDTALARAIYASGVPLSLLESEYWQAVFRLFDASYTLPSRHLLSNSLLDAEYIRVKKEIDNKLSQAAVLALICDGWTNITGKAVINFIITTPKPIFYNAVYPGTEKETALMLSEKIINVLTDIGPVKFIAVITDNAANMKAAWRIVTSKFPHISCVGCVSHALNLVYKDIFKITLFKETLDKVIKIIKYIKRCHVVNAHFEKYQKEHYGSAARSLKLFSKTRWSGAFHTLQSYKENREALEVTGISREVDILVEVKKDILDGELWVKIDEIVKILQPFALSILKTEKKYALLSDVPICFETLRSNIRQELQTVDFLNEEDQSIIMSSIEKRKNFCVQPIHYAAYQLDPRYCGEGLTEEEVAMASEYLRQTALRLSLDQVKVLTEMAEFQNKENFFDALKAMWVPVHMLEPRLWWKTFAKQHELTAIAIKILSVPPSSAACERNWSLFARTHTKTRNRLSSQRAVKLMSIRSNLSLLHKEDPRLLDLSVEESTDDEIAEEGESCEEDMDAADPLLH